MNADEATRVRQSASATTSPEILLVLANDPSVTVRASLALNPALPEQVNAILAEDTDARVRTILNRKLSTLTPGLGDDTPKRIQQDAVANLTALVADAAMRVRINLAGAVKNLPDGPRAIVLRLAHDPAVKVSEPVILLSPILTQEDLVTLIATEPPQSTLIAVANRPKIDAAVSDAIVGTADSVAICALLSNPTAQIREATLDSLAALSEEQVDWQALLIRRAHLPLRAQRLLAEIATGQLLETLSARSDLDPKVSQAVRTTLAAAEPTRPIAAVGGNHMLAYAHGLKQAGKLDDEAIVEALRRKAEREAVILLAVKAGVPIAMIERACALRSATGMVSLCWKAGLTVQTAIALQVALAHLPPDLVLRSGQEGKFPLSEEEMRWQLALLDVPETGARPWVPRRSPA